MKRKSHNSKNKGKQKLQLTKVLSRCDILGSELNFKYGHDNTFKTNIGGFFSILVLAALIFTFYDAVYRLIDTEKPEVSMSSTVSSHYPEMDLYQDQFSFAVGSYKQPNIVEVEELYRYVTPVAIVIRQDFVEVSSGVTPITYADIVDFIPCKDLEDKHSIEPFLQTSQLRVITEKYGLCPNITKDTGWKVAGKFNEPPNRLLKLEFFPCSLSNKDDCATEEEFYDFEIQLGIIRRGFNPGDFDNPAQTIPSYDRGVYVNPGQTKHYHLYMQTNEIWDDYKEFQDETLKKRYYSISSERMDVNSRDTSVMHCTTAEIKSLTCSPMLVVRIWSSGKKSKIIRRYNKIVQTMGEMGGNAEILFILGSVVYLWYNKFSIEKHFNKTLLNIDNRKEAAFYLFPENGKSQTSDKRIPIHAPPHERKLDITKKKQIIINPTNHQKSRSKKKIIPYSKTNKINPSPSESSLPSKETLKKAGEVISEFHESKINCINLFKLMDKLRILDKILFKSYHERLIPLAMLEMTKREMARNEQEEELKKMSRGKEDPPQIPQETIISIDEAYSRLANENPEYTLDKMINNFLISNLPSKLKENFYQKNKNNNNYRHHEKCGNNFDEEICNVNYKANGNANKASIAFETNEGIRSISPFKEKHLVSTKVFDKHSRRPSIHLKKQRPKKIKPKKKSLEKKWYRRVKLEDQDFVNKNSLRTIPDQYLNNYEPEISKYTSSGTPKNHKHNKQSVFQQQSIIQPDKKKKQHNFFSIPNDQEDNSDKPHLRKS